MTETNVVGAVIEENFVEREEKLVLKSLLFWLCVRFIRPLKWHVEAKHMPIVKTLQALEIMGLYAIVSDRDAWLIEKNATLFNVLARKYLKRVLPKQVYDAYGAISFVVNRRLGTVDICLLPPVFHSSFSEILPCSMTIIPNNELIKMVKADRKVGGVSKQLDIISFLKGNFHKIFTHDDVKGIHADFDEYKVDPDVVKDKETIIAARAHEDANLKTILDILSFDPHNLPTLKLATTMFIMVKTSYMNDPQQIMKIKFETTGTLPVKDFSKLFIINYDSNLDVIKGILEPMLPDMKIKISANKILFTTNNQEDPEDPKFASSLSTLIVDSEAGLSYFFDIHIGSSVSVGEATRIADSLSSDPDLLSRIIPETPDKP